ncbi:hypothetical protein QBC34DRAFT_413530 [Podospora aff. communis PSN243]|uniref:NADPH-dependent 1-acyldihydroxyacetone phosphate reductase n=1 Tax=Podospora aff. communis PSN243 TaxID=3040156 RepID=A0AAV9GDM9_9PEZI|nr:hypothetical protein QBC34DRAFT_413530 [Podospora aff. communis PSN243]
MKLSCSRVNNYSSAQLNNLEVINMAAPKRTILITGCSDGGLGAGLALAFHKAGWRVIASARNLAKLKEVTDAGIETIQLDTVSDDSIAAAVAAVSSLTGGSLDALLNNAGSGYSMPVLDVDIEKGKKLFDLNVWSVITVTRAFLPLLFKSTHPYGGLIVNNTSLSSIPGAGLPFQVTYSASKAAATQFTEGLRLELEPFGIKVVNLVTGSVKSPFYGNAGFEKLPPNSLYGLAKDVIEAKMNGENHAKDAEDRDVWAVGVVASLGKKNPSHWIYSGRFSTLVKYGQHLPIGTFDSMSKSMVGLDVFEKKLKEQGGPKAVIGKLD